MAIQTRASKGSRGDHRNATQAHLRCVHGSGQTDRGLPNPRTGRSPYRVEPQDRQNHALSRQSAAHGRPTAAGGSTRARSPIRSNPSLAAQHHRHIPGRTARTGRRRRPQTTRVTARGLSPFHGDPFLICELSVRSRHASRSSTDLMARAPIKTALRADNSFTSRLFRTIKSAPSLDARRSPRQGAHISGNGTQLNASIFQLRHSIKTYLAATIR